MTGSHSLHKLCILNFKFYKVVYQRSEAMWQFLLGICW